MCKPDSRHVVLDIETTGLYPQRGARIIEIGAVAVEQGQITAEFESLINFGKRIPGKTQKIHGLTSEMLLEQSGSWVSVPQLSRKKEVNHGYGRAISNFHGGVWQNGNVGKTRYWCNSG